jgi:hypothetical protein
LFGDGFAPDKNRAGRRFKDAVEVLKKRALPGAIRSDHRDAGVSRDNEIDVIQGSDIARVDIAEIAGLDEVHWYRKLDKKR